MGKIIKILLSVLFLLSFISIVQATVETGWTGPNIPRNPTDGHIDFEEGVDNTKIVSQISGIQFTGSGGYDWIYLDHRTGNWNYPTYYWIGNFAAYCGATQNWGRIDFTEGNATYFSVLVATYSGVTVDAYDSAGNLIANSGWATSNIGTNTMTRLTVETSDGSPTIAYVIVHDTGNYWCIDEICTDAPGIPGQTNEPPVANAGGPYTGLVGEPLTFDASSSSDPDGSIVLYEWDWNNDGVFDQSSTQPSGLSHSFDSFGVFTVALKVTDDDGATATATTSVTVRALPVANAGPDQFMLLGETVSFNGGSSTDPDGTIVAYDWNFGDGSAHGTGVTTTHLYAAARTYNVVLTVTDNDGLTDTDTAIVNYMTSCNGINYLKTVVNGMTIKASVKTGLNSKLTNANTLCVNGQKASAIKTMNNFITQCNTQRGLALTNTQADTLVNWANRIIAALRRM